MSLVVKQSRQGDYLFFDNVFKSVLSDDSTVFGITIIVLGQSLFISPKTTVVCKRKLERKHLKLAMFIKFINDKY